MENTMNNEVITKETEAMAMSRKMMATLFLTVRTTNLCNGSQALSLGQSSDCPLHTYFQKIKNHAFLKATSCIYY